MTATLLEDDVIRTAPRCDHPTRHPRPRSQRSPRQPETCCQIDLTVSRPFGGAVVIHVAGEIDLLTAPLLERAVLAELHPAPAVLVLDMEQVGFLGTSGLTALVNALDAVERIGGRLSVAFPSRAVRRVLDVVGLAGWFDLHPVSAPAR